MIDTDDAPKRLFIYSFLPFVVFSLFWVCFFSSRWNFWRSIFHEYSIKRNPHEKRNKEMRRKKNLNFIQFKLISFYDIILWSWIDTVIALVLVFLVFFCLHSFLSLIHCPSTSWFPHQLAYFIFHWIQFWYRCWMLKEEEISIKNSEIFNTHSWLLFRS